MSNECGECNACCMSLGFTNKSIVNDYDETVQASLEEIKVLDITFPYGGVCNKLSDDGDCSIYEKRPYVCRKYKCGYLEYDLPMEMRPDIIGVMANYEKETAFGTRDAITFNLVKGFDWEYIPRSNIIEIHHAIERAVGIKGCCNVQAPKPEEIL